MDETRIAELRAACGRATPGPWTQRFVWFALNEGGIRLKIHVEGVLREAEAVVGKEAPSGVIATTGRMDDPQSIADGEFIAAARVGLPEALDWLQKRDRELKELRFKFETNKYTEDVGGMAHLRSMEAFHHQEGRIKDEEIKRLRQIGRALWKESDRAAGGFTPDEIDQALGEVPAGSEPVVEDPRLLGLRLALNVIEAHDPNRARSVDFVNHTIKPLLEKKIKELEAGQYDPSWHPGTGSHLNGSEPA